MPRRIEVKGSLTVEDLEQRYRKADDPVERSRWQIIWLIAQRKKTEEVEEVTGYSLFWIRKIIQDYNREGEQGVHNKRKDNKGAPSLLTPEQLERLRTALHTPPPDGGLWNGPKVAKWLSEELGREIRPQRGWDYFRRCGARIRRLRRRHTKANKEAQKEFKEVELPAKIEEVAQAHQGDIVEPWSMDEHRLGLKPILRAVWLFPEQEPIAPVCQGYEWFYLYAFVHPSSGRSHWLILPRVNTALFSLALQDFAEAVGANKGIQIVLTIDRAGWHTSQQVTIPAGIHFAPLPAYSPELQPAERVWQLTDEPLVNKAWNSIEDMMDVLAKRCQYLSQALLELARKTLFHWWPQDRILPATT